MGGVENWGGHIGLEGVYRDEGGHIGLGGHIGRIMGWGT